MSVPQLNSTQTIEMPADDEDLTLLTFPAPLTAVSTGKVTKRSTSSGAIPCASVSTTTVGAVRSGNTSTSMREAVYAPMNNNSTDAAITSSLLCKEKYIILFSTLFDLFFLCT